MDPNTGRVVRLLKGEPLPDGHVEIPALLTEEAEALLREQREGYVDLEGHSPLSQFAADCRRHKAKKKARNRRLRKQAKGQRRG